MAAQKKKENYGEQAVKDLQSKQRQKQQANIPKPDNGYSQISRDSIAQQAQQQASPMNGRPELFGFERMMQGKGVGVPGVDTPIPGAMGNAPSTPPPAVFGQGVQRQMMQEETPVHGVGFEDTETGPELVHDVVDREMINKLTFILLEYKSGKASIDRRVRASEEWWRKRNAERAAVETGKEITGTIEAETSWLHNVLTNKHADALEAYPIANVLPREAGDKLDAWALSHILPVVFEQNKFPKVYDRVIWSKMKFGTGIYQVTWDANKLNGLGDVEFRRTNILNLFWEPEIDDIQDSRYVFHVEIQDKDELREQYPQLEGKVLQSVITPVEMPKDDHASDAHKVAVIDCYYKKWQGGRKVLHYVKYVGDTVLYATENDPVRKERGLYDHGLYPFVFDVLFPIEDSCAGYGYVDICANAQIRIDLLNTAFTRNTLAGATPRYFCRNDGGVNKEQFCDLNEMLIDVDGNLGDDSLRVVDYKPLSGNYINHLNATIDEIRETSGNTETATGSSTHGVTAASAFAALQEAAGKLSRASTTVSWDAYSDVTYMVIELIRQFYDMPRQFRITGDMGVARFVPFSNQFIKPQAQGTLGGVDLGYRQPVFDLQVVPQKKTVYTKLSQNELAIQFYSLGFFNPQMTDQALAALEMMDFDGKDELAQRIKQNGDMFQLLQLYKAMAATLAAKHEPQLTGGLLGAGRQQQPEKISGGEKPDLDRGSGEESHVKKARQRAAEAGQPGGKGA